MCYNKNKTLQVSVLFTDFNSLHMYGWHNRSYYSFIIIMIIYIHIILVFY